MVADRPGSFGGDDGAVPALRRGDGVAPRDVAVPALPPEARLLRGGAAVRPRPPRGWRLRPQARSRARPAVGRFPPAFTNAPTDGTTSLLPWLPSSRPGT